MTELQKDAYKSYKDALKNGLLVPADKCEKCGGSKRIHGHHEDYTEPLAVMWLCSNCHKGRHKELGWGVGGGVRRKRLPIPIMDTEIEYLTIQEYAKKLRISARTVRRYIKDGKLSVVRLGSHTWRIPVSELKAEKQ